MNNLSFLRAIIRLVTNIKDYKSHPRLEVILVEDSQPSKSWIVRWAASEQAQQTHVRLVSRNPFIASESLFVKWRSAQSGTQALGMKQGSREWLYLTRVQA